MFLDHLQRKPDNGLGLLLTINSIPKRQNNSKISTCFLRIFKFSYVLIQQLIVNAHCNGPVYFSHDRLCSLKPQDKINSSSLTLIGQVFSDSHTWNPCKTRRRESISLSCLLTFLMGNKQSLSPTPANSMSRKTKSYNMVSLYPDTTNWVNTSRHKKGSLYSDDTARNYGLE